MAIVNRKLRQVQQMSDAVSDFYDCDACLWPGVTVGKGEEDKAQREFDALSCKDYPVRSRMG